MMSARPVLLLSVALLAGLTACAPADQQAAPAAPTDCAVDQLPLHAKGKLTIATDDPAYEPWFIDNDPANGKGFESAVAYAVAEQMGFAKTDVVWTKVPFNTAYQPGVKQFDFDINQISITPDRAKAVDFSKPYYKMGQAVIALKGSKFANAKTFADLQGARLGAQIGTTSLEAITDYIKPGGKPMVYDDTTKAVTALQNNQVDAIVADVPTASYLVSSELPDGQIVGRFELGADKDELGLLLTKGSGLTGCVDTAIAALDADGKLAELEKTWLSDFANLPVLTQ